MTAFLKIFDENGQEEILGVCEITIDEIFNKESTSVSKEIKF